MTWLFLFLTAPTALAWALAFGATLWMVRSIRVLAELPPRPGPPPKVSVVSPGCNEAESIQRSVQSWLAESDAELQIVAVNDRSTDETGAILDRLAAADPRVTTVHLNDLPDGWLGKVHALHRGTAKATGDWLLFADADVHLAPGTIARAVAYAESEELDLLTAFPEIESAGFWGDVAWSALGATVGLSGMWRSRDPKSERAFAVGAFILIRRSAFEQTPGFAWIKLEVADDQGLAILMKSHGHRCDIVNGRGLVRLTWYSSLRDMVHKSQKNWFGILGRFSLARCLVLATLCVCAALSPLAVALPDIEPLLMCVPLLGQLSFLGAALVQSRWARRPLLPALFAPLGLLIAAFMVARAGVLGRRQGGIEWRGVLYPSEMLRGQQRFEM